MELLKKLVSFSAPSGRESALCAFIEKEMTGYCDEMYKDALGNLICHIKGSGRKIMLAAHMDEAGLIVTFIDEKGFLRFGKVGSLQDADLINRKIIFENGTVGIISYENKEKSAEADIGKMYIDIGAGSREEAEKMVQIGSMASFSCEFDIIGDKIISKAMSARAGCYAVIKAVKSIKDKKNDIYAVFTVQSEVGQRGARAAAFEISPEIGITVDVSETGDTPGSKDSSLSLGCGVGIKIKDESFLSDECVRTALTRCANAKNIPFSLHAEKRGRTDTGAIQLASDGAMVGAVSVPCRYIRSAQEIVNRNDLENAAVLLKSIAENAFV